MKLKTKNFDWLAGRPVVILTEETAKKLNVHLDERVSISFEGKKIFAVVDLFQKIVKEGEVGLSNEINSYLKIKENSLVEVSSAPLPQSSKIIKKKLYNQILSQEEIELLISDIVNNKLTEAEIAYFIAAEKICGMSMQEIIYLTKAMVDNGKKLNFENGIIADKHCIGGIAGNRTTPIVVSICAAAGLKMPKTSSRAITSAAGTADVIETIANVEISSEEIKKIVNKVGACLAWGGSLGLAPSDDKIIQVERLLNLDVEPQLLASIMSKKISVGTTHLLIDIPYGDGAKIKKSEAKKLGKKFKLIAKNFGINLRVVLTEGEQPIGNGIGPVLEMLDVISILKNKEYCPQDLREKALFLASEIMDLCGIKDARGKAEEILLSGMAFQKFKEIIEAQNGKKDFEARIKNLKPAQFSKNIYAHKSGKIIELKNKKINQLCRILGTPESQKAGIYLNKHLGEVKENEVIFTMYSESEQKLQEAYNFIKSDNVFKIK